MHCDLTVRFVQFHAHCLAIVEIRFNKRSPAATKWIENQVVNKAEEFDATARKLSWEWRRVPYSFLAFVSWE
jgi:hypothetical protein